MFAIRGPRRIVLNATAELECVYHVSVAAVDSNILHLKKKTSLLFGLKEISDRVPCILRNDVLVWDVFCVLLIAFVPRYLSLDILKWTTIAQIKHGFASYTC